ncbi:hypothetical protein A6C57_05745 [Fibrella sp. ES10-3-2-2]|nr:hypothetical protein A6C57_05745 [Fibrella sp. ES10-3-2-2]
MKISSSLFVVLFLFSCEKPISPFTINPVQVYTPTELSVQATGSCDVTHLWEGKTVNVAGHIEALNLFSNKFWLYDTDGRGFVEIYYADPSAQSGRDIYEFAKANTGRAITITGLTVGNSMPTQSSCRKGLSITIANKTAIKF